MNDINGKPIIVNIKRFLEKTKSKDISQLLDSSGKIIDDMYIKYKFSEDFVRENKEIIDFFCLSLNNRPFSEEFIKEFIVELYPTMFSGKTLKEQKLSEDTLNYITDIVVSKDNEYLRLDSKKREFFEARFFDSVCKYQNISNEYADKYKDQLVKINKLMRGEYYNEKNN